MANEREHIYLAAMLHDIGKFYQRADSGSVSTSNYLSEHCKTESTYCPLYQGRYSHKHVLWTAQFIEDYAPSFKALLNTELSGLGSDDTLMSLASSHHLSSEQLSELGKIIKEADCLSSGMDRSSEEAMKDAQDEDETSWDLFKKKRAVSILETIGRGKDDVMTTHLPIAKLSLTQDSFAKPSFDKTPDYEKLWSEFIIEFEKFKLSQTTSYKAFSETLLNLLYKYTSCIPSSTINFADVSLYDHLKTTAALAVCLYDYKQSGEKGDAPFLLIGADFSGIQPYIYEIVSKYAAKNLKGRSFYLRILSDAVVRYILKELNLFQANVVYNSGGGFYIIAPNTEEAKEKLSCAVKVIEQKLFENHRTSLYCAIDSVEVSKDVLIHKGKTLADVWGELFEKRDRKKSSKFAQLITSNYEKFFEPSGIGADQDRDSITGEEFVEGETKVKFNKDEKKDSYIKPLTALQIKLGEKLRSMDVMVISEEGELPYWKVEDMVKVTPLDLGITYYLLKDEDIRAKREQLKGSADKVVVVTMNGKNGDCNFLRKIDGVNNIYALEFYGGNEVDDREVPTFEEMCQAEGADGLSRLGVLRMDVDNLGHIFQQGISPERATLSRYAALSRSLDYFFSGYLNTIWRTIWEDESGVQSFCDQTFVIYSGGDDVFIVGRWDKTIEFAKQIARDFKKYVSNNPNFTISAGVSIMSPSYPIMKGAEEGGVEEHRAKNHTCQGSSKNSISFLGMALNWMWEYDVVEKLKNDILRELTNNRLPKSFISKLGTHYATAKIENHKITNPKTYWMLTYDLSRMKKRQANEASTLLENCINEICGKEVGKLNAEQITTEYHPLELWTLAARWAELEYRTKEKNNNN